MKVKDAKSVWGISTHKLVEYGKRSRLVSILLYIIDIAVVVSMVVYMYKHGISFGGYLTLMLLSCLAFVLIYSLCINATKWGAFKFYWKNRSKVLIEGSYDIDADKLYSILYCARCKRLKQGRELDIYKEQLLSACCEDYVYAKRVMKYISKYEATDGSFKLYYTKRGNSMYFVDFKSEEDKENE